MSRLNGFDGVAPYYDFLKRIVFGRAIKESEQHFLKRIPPGNVLILGGGTGDILPPLLRSQPECNVWYVEASSQMLRLTMRKVTDAHRRNVRLIHGTEGDIPSDVVFQAVITNFFLDLFTDETVSAMCEKIPLKMATDGLWVVTDFVDGGKWWHGLLLRMMYRFFRITSGIDARKLPAWERHLRTGKLKEEECELFCSGFIKSAIYRKIIR